MVLSLYFVKLNVLKYSTYKALVIVLVEINSEKRMTTCFRIGLYYINDIRKRTVGSINYADVIVKGPDPGYEMPELDDFA